MPFENWFNNNFKSNINFKKDKEKHEFFFLTLLVHRQANKRARVLTKWAASHNSFGCYHCNSPVFFCSFFFLFFFAVFSLLFSFPYRVANEPLLACLVVFAFFIVLIFHTFYHLAKIIWLLLLTTPSTLWIGKISLIWL
jgi:hypothetical protein